MRSAGATLILALAAGVQAGSFYEQSIARTLEQRFPETRLSYLLLNSQTRNVMAARWEDAQKPSPVGSLIKPFTALAYGELHRYQYPEYVCRGKGCWLPRGHGRVDLVQAIAHSCNAYFLALASGMPARPMRRFGLGGPPEGSSPETLAGLGDGWKVSPLALARAYCELAERAEDPGAAEILRGMALSARSGTGKGVPRLLGEATLVKTGTAPCSHARRAPGDGYAVVLFPPERPRLALLVRVHGTTGAEAATVAGRMLRLVRKGQ